MKLSELNPAYRDRKPNDTLGYISFDCPCGKGEKHRIENLKTTRGDASGEGGSFRWKLTGSPPDWDSVSLNPSIDYKGHWHGHVTNGEVTNA